MKNSIFYILLSVVAFGSCKISSIKKKSTNEVNLNSGTFTNLGVQLKSVNLQASSFAEDINGEEYAYVIARGRPGHLIGYNMKSKKVVIDLKMDAAEGAIDMVLSTDNWLYVGASNGHLLRTRPGSQELEDLGKALDGTSEILDLIPGKDGEIFGGTFPTGKIFRYHPKDGFSDVAGQILEGESYVRSIVYQHSTSKLYAGIGSHAHLIELDPKTGAKKEILPEKYFDREFIYYMGIAEGLDGGDRLLAWATNPKDRETLVFNLQTDTLEQVIESLDADALIKSKTSNDVYFTAGNKLYKNDLTKIGQKSTFLADCYEAKHMKWGNDGKLYILTKYGQVNIYDPVSGKITTEKIDASPQPYGIQTLITGPDGKIWSSGYLHGGNAVFDPKTQQSISYTGLGQAEGMISYGSSIYFGIYPQARFYVYDTNKEWKTSAENPRFIGKVEGQDRPFATAGLEDQGKIYFGTIPAYGKLGGAIIEYDIKNDKLKTFANVVQDQSVTSLLYNKGVVWGGTTIFGGLGAKPLQKEGKVFVWDPVNNVKLFEFTPVPGTMAMTCLINGPKNKIWGLADGVIFILDPVTKEVEKTKKLFDIDQNPTHIWRIGFLQMHPSGYVYGTANGDFFRVDPNSMEVTILKQGVGLLAMDAEGVLYMRDTENLWSYRP